MSLTYTLVGTADGVVLSVFDGEDAAVATERTHPNIKQLIELAQAGDPKVFSLIDPTEAIVERFEKLTRKVSISGDTIYLNGDPAPPAISDAIMRHYRAGEDFTALANFLERLGNNPNQDSVNQLYAWLETSSGFTITEDGMLVGYKGVEHHNGEYLSIRSGRAIVDGEVKVGRIPQVLGSEVEMPRSEVQFNPSVGCSVGLHVGTWDYASTFGHGTVLEVEVDPADVVSVPHDSGAQKLRTCRYKVTDVLDAPHDSVVRGHDSFEVDYDFDYDEWDGWGEIEYDETATFTLTGGKEAAWTLNF